MCGFDCARALSERFSTALTYSHVPSISRSVITGAADGQRVREEKCKQTIFFAHTFLFRCAVF